MTTQNSPFLRFIWYQFGTFSLILLLAGGVLLSQSLRSICTAAPAAPNPLFLPTKPTDSLKKALIEGHHCVRRLRPIVRDAKIIRDIIHLDFGLMIASRHTWAVASCKDLIPFGDYINGRNYWHALVRQSLKRLGPDPQTILKISIPPDNYTMDGYAFIKSDKPGEHPGPPGTLRSRREKIDIIESTGEPSNLFVAGLTPPRGGQSYWLAAPICPIPERYEQDVAPAYTYFAANKHLLGPAYRLPSNQNELLSLLVNKNILIASTASRFLTWKNMGARSVNGPMQTGGLIRRTIFAFRAIRVANPRAIAAIKILIRNAKDSATLKPIALGAYFDLWWHYGPAREIFSNIAAKEETFHTVTAADQYVQELLHQAATMKGDHSLQSH